jgi:glycosyltransferase involved in cell wall biosynthesis
VKVFFIGRYGESEILSGPEKVAKRIFFEHTKKNNSVFLEYFFDGAEYGYSKKLFGKELVCAVNNSRILRMGIFPLFFFLVKNSPDILHLITFERFQLVVLFYAFLFRKKIIYNVHGINCYEEKKFKKTGGFLFRYIKFVEKRILKSSDKLLILSPETLNLMEKYYRIDSGKIIMVSNGVDEIFYLISKKRTENNEKKINVAFIADIFRPEKGFNNLLEALRTIDVPVIVHLLGQKSKDFKIQIENPNVEFVFKENFPTNDFAEYLLKIDVVVSASIYEPFSISAAESTVTGLVPVLTAQTGFARFIINNVSGFIIDYDNILGLKSIIETLCKDIKKRESIKLKTPGLYSELNWNKVYSGYENIYESLVK